MSIEKSKLIGKGNFETMPTEVLTDYPQNTHKHTDQEVAELAEVMKTIGWTRPILIDEDNVILAGHRARRAAVLLGEESVPVLRKRGLTEDQKRHIVIYDNQSTKQGEWDAELLAGELALLDKQAPDLFKNLGFSDDELAGFYEEFEKPEKKTRAKKRGISDASAVRSIKLTFPIEVFEQIVQSMDEDLEKYELENYSELVAKYAGVSLPG